MGKLRLSVIRIDQHRLDETEFPALCDDLGDRCGTEQASGVMVSDNDQVGFPTNPDIRDIIPTLQPIAQALATAGWRVLKRDDDSVGVGVAMETGSVHQQRANAEDCKTRD
jgi:hypothetical protein